MRAQRLSDTTHPEAGRYRVRLTAIVDVELDTEDADTVEQACEMASAYVRSLIDGEESNVGYFVYECEVNAIA